MNFEKKKKKTTNLREISRGRILEARERSDVIESRSRAVPRLPRWRHAGSPIGGCSVVVGVAFRVTGLEGGEKETRICTRGARVGGRQVEANVSASALADQARPGDSRASCCACLPCYALSSSHAHARYAHIAHATRWALFHCVGVALSVTNTALLRWWRATTGTTAAEPGRVGPADRQTDRPTLVLCTARPRLERDGALQLLRWARCSRFALRMYICTNKLILWYPKSSNKSVYRVVANILRKTKKSSGSILLYRMIPVAREGVSRVLGEKFMVGKDSG